MMRRGNLHWKVLALLLVLGSIAGTLSAKNQDDDSGTVRVSGVLEGNGGKLTYRLKISAESGTAFSGRALLVYAEPSHTLLLAHVDPVGSGLESYRGALAMMRGALHAFQHSVTVPYHPLTDRRVVVVVRKEDGQEWVAADALVNLRKFEFSTTISAEESYGELPSAAKYTHCCRGGSCDRICAECETASFTCNLIDCDIQCGHDLTWPPKY